MAIVNQPTPLSNELAWNGDKNPIPDTNDGSKGLFSVEYGFPYVTQQPLAQGGIPPQRNDFNGVLNLLSKFIVYFQNGGVFAYNASMDYSVGMLVRSGDRLYVCKAENGANTSAGVQNVSNSNYWNEITLEDTLGDTLINQLKMVLVTEQKVANNTTDWNTLTESRTYKILGATFSATYHQPVGANGNGELVVLKNGTDTIIQVYYANSTQPNQAGAFHRVYFNNAWTSWVYNITNKGGTVTGDFNINGKLTVDTIQVKQNLYIGDYDPSEQVDQNKLTAEALQKLQDQIIAPIQRMLVDSIDGSDETGDGTWSNPFKTIDKAVSKIRKNVPTVEIYLQNKQPNQKYYMSPIDFYNKGNTYFYMRINDWANSNPVNKVNVTVGYGKCHRFFNYEGETEVFLWGNFVAANIEKARFDGINFYIEPGYPNVNTLGFLNFVNDFTMYYGSVTAENYAINVSGGLDKKISLQNCCFSNLNGLLFGDVNRINVHATDPSLSNNDISLMSVTVNGSLPTTLQAIAFDGTKIPDSVLNHNLGNSGIDKNVVVLYKNWD